MSIEWLPIDEAAKSLDRPLVATFERSEGPAFAVGCWTGAGWVSVARERPLKPPPTHYIARETLLALPRKGG
jgi:hypothetical protein